MRQDINYVTLPRADGVRFLFTKRRSHGKFALPLSPYQLLHLCQFPLDLGKFLL